ncbi:MAG: T9SS type A sorting domain-containing protein [Flavobacteriales bacterium]|nr:T9SS type A sorting domain-containing protein [Flavobacteriales bacterium]MBP6696459.1 T9SS type A sorting domain-containing protein [Flavobacteriales bacterium]
MLYDATGRKFTDIALNGARTFDTHGMNEGIYWLMIRALDGALLSRQRLIIAG